MKMKALNPVLHAAACVLFLASVGVNLAAAADSPSARFDGPAELPRILVKSSLADTPAPGHVRLVKEGDNLQEAINSAQCGDTLKLQAGAVFQGLFRLPNKSCDDSHWVVLCSAAPDR